MAVNSSNNLYGFPQPLSRVFPAPIIAQRAPTVNDISYPIGQIWIDEVGMDGYILTNVAANVASWNVMAVTPGNVDTISGNSGGDLAPTAGNIAIIGAGPLAFAGAGSTLTGSITPGTALVSTIAGSSGGNRSPTAGNIILAQTPNQILTSGSGSTITFSLSTNLIAPGSVAATTSLTATLGNITATNGNLVLGTAGNKIVSSSVGSSASAGANSFGKVTLVGGTVVVATSAVTASSIIMLSRQSVGATGAAALGTLSVGTISAGVSFVINAWSAADATSLQASDVSSIGWMIIN
jgi:hypothetical protein